MFLKVFLVLILSAVVMAQYYGAGYGGYYGTPAQVYYSVPGGGGYGYGGGHHGGDGGYYGGDGYHGGGYGGGYGPLPYKFGYKAYDPKYGGSHHRQESGDGSGGVTGSYGYTDGKGHYREVNYVADKGGFKATVHTNEPGTANQNPAAVSMNSQHGR